VVIPYLTVTLLFASFQRRLTYRPTAAANLSVSALELDPQRYRDVEITTPDNATLRGWLINTERPPANDRSVPLVIYFPGNAENRHHRIFDLREITTAGFDLLIFDYRSYGDSTGSPSESALTADARLIWNYATEVLGTPADRIVLFGESLGGAVVLSLWTENIETPPHPAAIILSSTFASMSKTVGWHYPYFPFRYLLLDRWPSIDRISRVQTPITIFHGTSDDIVPFAQAEQLAAAGPSSTNLIKISGGTHNDIPKDQLRTTLEHIATAIQ